MRCLVTAKTVGSNPIAPARTTYYRATHRPQGRRGDRCRLSLKQNRPKGRFCCMTWSYVAGFLICESTTCLMLTVADRTAIISIQIDIFILDINHITPKCCKKTGSSAELIKTAEFLKVVAEENRLKILCILRSGERCVCDIWQFLDLPQNLTSHHLKVLKDFGLVKDRKDGLRVYYSINKTKMSKFNSSLNNLLQTHG